ncbi:nucleotidyltransferase family protein [Enterovirga rhinocerotis]|uniref:Molybdenum cofactor cytidylyltransferase n=1 Tax=Enterovirga rhinocerotis TaxID=1339210 RepID=A0A4R7C8H2_9HYPH|nr:nucleotidyltransferase family protein [Enterovirga rhinocerotis]TDR93017.1 molybdenum cofactor cytidylyltransferase [Enterovirga rhinocerotis]
MSVAAIVLAAGRGTRFGATPKMLAAFEGKPLVCRAAEAALESEAAPVIVVVGHEAEAVSSALAGLDVVIVENRDYRDGLSTSLKAGFAALPEEAEAAAILLGDMPQIGTALVDWLIKAWRSSGRPAALVPTFEGVRGNPTILSMALAPAIAGLSGDTGAAKLLRGIPDVVEIELGDPAVARDADTPQDLADLAEAQASTTPTRTAE